MKARAAGRSARFCTVTAGLLCLAMAGAPGARADTDLYELSLDELMQISVDTASIQLLSVREQPGLVTVLTAADLTAAGVRTLQEALLLVPGISNGIDVFNVTGLAMRGSWAYEGKVLFLIDDQPVNDLLFGVYAIPPDFPVDVLDRIEVLRGPGGAKYGANAQLAVIRIYTRNAEVRPGFASLTLATHKDGTPLRQVSAGGQHMMERGRLALLGSVATGNQGDGIWTDALGRRVDTSELDVRSGQLALRAEWGGTRLDGYYEKFRSDAVQTFGITRPDQLQYFRQANLTLQHAFVLSPALTLTPSWNWRNENTWEGTSYQPATAYELPAERHHLEVEARYELAEGAVLRGGVQAERVHATARRLLEPFAFPGRDASNYFNGSDHTRNDSHAAYAEAELPWSDYRLSLGARYSRQDVAGSSTSPRLAITRAEADWHFKGLWGSAFREPQIETLNQSARPDKSLEAERMHVNELEAGYRLWQQSYVTGSVYHYHIRDIIIFGTDASGMPGYVNSPTLHARGAELAWMTRAERWRLDANYSYSETDDDDLPAYDVIGQSGQAIGVTRHVANAWLARRLGEGPWSLQARLRYLGSRTATDYDPALVTSGGLALRQRRLDDEVTLALSARYQPAKWSLEAGIGNVGDAGQVIAQPYSGISPPWPGGGREFWLRLQYRQSPATNDTEPLRTR